MSMQTTMVEFDPAGPEVRDFVDAVLDDHDHPAKALALLIAATAMAADLYGCPNDQVVENFREMAADLRQRRGPNHPANAEARGH